MSTILKCPHCQAELSVWTDSARRKVRCRECGGMIALPGISSPPRRLPPGKPKPGGASLAALHKPMLAPRQRHEEDLIDMTAMVDIVFFLLIFFLVTSMQMAATVLPLPTPERQAASQKTAAVPTQADPGTIVVRIDADDVILVDDEVIFGGTALQAALADARDQRSPDAPVLVIGSGDASHGAAVRVLDACASARLANVRFLVEDDEAAP